VHDEAHAGGAHRLHLHPGASQLVSTDRSSSDLYHAYACGFMYYSFMFFLLRVNPLHSALYEQ
jgi:hypothetical protein